MAVTGSVTELLRCSVLSRHSMKEITDSFRLREEVHREDAGVCKQEGTND